MAFARRSKREWERELSLVWMGEALHRREKLPPLQELLHGPQRQAEDQQKAMWHYIADSLGITVRKHDKRSKRFRIIR